MKTRTIARRIEVSRCSDQSRGKSAKLALRAIVLAGSVLYFAGFAQAQYLVDPAPPVANVELIPIPEVELVPVPEQVGVYSDLPLTEQALNKMASYVVAGGDHADHRLRQLGYDHPGITDEAWRSFTPQTKIETAYLSAEAGGKGGGGRMLAMLSKSLAIDYESARYDAHLTTYVNFPDDGTPLRFATLEPAADDSGSRAQLTTEAHQAVEAASKYCDGGKFGPRTVLTEYFQLDEWRTTEILRTSRTHKQVLERGLLAVEAPQRGGAMGSLISELRKEYEPARSEPAFESWPRTPGEPLSQLLPVEPGLDATRGERWSYRDPAFRTLESWNERSFGNFKTPEYRSERSFRDFNVPDYSFREFKATETHFERPSLHTESRPGIMEHASGHGGRLVGILVLVDGLLALGVPAPVVLGIGAVFLGIWVCGVLSSIGKSLFGASASGSIRK